MPRKTKKEQLEQRQDVAAPFLFDEDALPHRPDLVKAVVEKRYEHTGARLLEDDNKVLQLVDLLLRTPPVGLRKIARALGCSRDTIRAAREALVSQGKLRPYKERLVAMYEDFTESSIAMMVRSVELGTYSMQRIAFDHGIIFDKRALALGEPTAISVGATAQLKATDLSVEKLNSWVEALPAEGESTGKLPAPAQTGGEPVFDAASDAAGPRPDVRMPEPAPAARPATDGPNGKTVDGPEAGGGGQFREGGG